MAHGRQKGSRKPRHTARRVYCRLVNGYSGGFSCTCQGLGNHDSGSYNKNISHDQVS